MKKILFLIIFLTLGQAQAESPAFIYGTHLYRMCVKTDTSSLAKTAEELGNCFGYIEGVSDTLLGLGSSFGKKFICLPQDLSELYDEVGLTRHQKFLGDIRAAVARYLEKNPDKAANLGASIVAAAMSERFPCEE